MLQHGLTLKQSYRHHPIQQLNEEKKPRPSRKAAKQRDSVPAAAAENIFQLAFDFLQMPNMSHMELKGGPQCWIIGRKIQ